MKRRLAAALLSVCLALGPCAGSSVPVYGASDAVQIKAERNTLEVEAVSTQQFPFEGRVTIGLSNDSGVIQAEEFEIPKGASKTAGFHVPEGDYTVRIQAGKFADYTQSVHVEAGWTHKVKVYSSRIQNGTSAVPGWLRPGDVDGDGDIDEADSKALLEAVQTEKAGTVYDLNSDGRVDLADLSFLVQGMHEKQESSVEKNWIPDASRAAAADGTELADGSGFEAMFQKEGSVKLRNSSGKLLSVNDPAAFTVVLAEEGANPPELGGMTIKAPEDADGNADGNGMISSQISDGTAQITYVGENGRDQTLQLSLVPGQKPAALSAMSAGKHSPSVSTEPDGSLVLDFGGQIAVKRVTIRITGTRKEQPLAEIAEVTFVNNMEGRIPAPQLDIPSITAVTPGSKKLSVSWSAQKNITGYELYIFGQVKNQDRPQSQIIAVPDTGCEVVSINQNSLVNYKEYVLKVRSVNGDWRSPWSEAKTAKPLPQGRPAPPDYVKAEGACRSLTVSWKDMDDSDGYMVYYKEKGASDYQPAVQGFVQTADGAGRLDGTSYTVRGLKEHVSYSAYVISWNEFGWSSRSLVSEASTRSEAVPVLPSYKLLNTPNGVGQVTAHIVDAVIGGSNASMVSSPLDTKADSGLGLVDNDYASYWSKFDWEDGVRYPDDSKGMTITLDQDYLINYFTFAAADQKAGVSTVRIEYWGGADADHAKTVGARLLEKQDANDNPYYIVKLDQTIQAYKVKMSIGRSYDLRTEMKVGEIRFYQYDPLEDEIMALYQDEMHTTLRDAVTLDTIKELEGRLNQTDKPSGEKHPLYEELALEIQTAKEILAAGLDAAYVVNPQITAQKDTHLGFGGLNAWQPLGKTAYAGETLLVYVGHNTKRTGDAAQLQLVFTQHHAEAANAARTVSLRVGRNVITVPQLTSTDAERGGQIYAAYTGNSALDQYAVRISGGSSIPVLDVYGKTGTERTQAVRAYVQKLEQHAASLETEHDRVHKGMKNVDAYDPKNCILNATDIQMEQMMYSLPATQVLAGIGAGKNLDEKVSQLDAALRAMEQMMTLFYQHKGLSSTAGTSRGNNALPSQHLNIRYMRMFAGAFMYAAGNHIGIEWGSAPLAGASNSWTGFGWGIAHEIGHNINQGSYAAAEITNNYFAQLMKKIADGTTRFDYRKVYRKVTSGTTGRSPDVFTQLAMYWQLYLAYSNEKDDGRIYDNYEEQFQNLFFARVDTYARNPQNAPMGGVTLGGSTDQNLMRLACAAAGKNLLPFFERWGMVPDDTTSAYAEKFPDETKALYYINDAARDYRISHPDGEAAETVKDQDVVTAMAAADEDSGQVAVAITAPADKERILGYEILRSMTSNGKKETKTAGFVQIDETAAVTIFKDNIGAVNNRVVSYEVRAVDQYLNYSNAADAGSVKIETKGILNKSLWTVETNMISKDDQKITVDTENPDSGYDAENPADVKEAEAGSIVRIIDDERDAGQGIYREDAGNVLDTAFITIDLHKTEAVTALKYQGSKVASLTVETSRDGQNWETVKAGCNELSDARESDDTTIWFDAVRESERENWTGTYDARYVKLTLQKTGAVSIHEIELCGPSGDNLEFLTADSGQPSVGRLAADYAYGSGEEDVIPAGSLVFTGIYKGNPAYNVVLLYDADGNVVGGKDGSVYAGQVIFAPVPERGSLGETSTGTWVYYVEPGQWEEAQIHSLKGVRGELYRVDDAKAMERERVVSDTRLIQIPSKLPAITLTGSRFQAS